jgi:hypothetical protein
VDLDKLRVALRRMSRGNLLILAERAIEIVPKAKLAALIGDMVRLEDLVATGSGEVPLLEEVRRFHDAAMNHEYYESFNVNSKNYMEKSRATETFIVEFDRLLTKCIRATEKKPRQPVRTAFDLLFALLRRIDEDSDSIVFFADEGGAWQVGVEWRVALPAYFQCLADASTGDEFAAEVERAISDFDEDAKPKHRAAARSVANTEQKTALARLAKGSRHRRDA